MCSPSRGGSASPTFPLRCRFWIQTTSSQHRYTSSNVTRRAQRVLRSLYLGLGVSLSVRPLRGGDLRLRFSVTTATEWRLAALSPQSVLCPEVTQPIRRSIPKACAQTPTALPGAVTKRVTKHDCEHCGSLLFILKRGSLYVFIFVPQEEMQFQMGFFL